MVLTFLFSSVRALFVSLCVALLELLSQVRGRVVRVQYEEVLEEHERDGKGRAGPGTP